MIARFSWRLAPPNLLQKPVLIKDALSETILRTRGAEAGAYSHE